MLMGFRRDFSRGWQRRYFAYPFSDCKRCNGNGHLQNALPFQHRKETSPWKHADALYSSLRKVCTFCHPSQLLL